MSKLIDQQVVIDAVEAMMDKSGKGEIAGFYNAILERVIDKLIALPSAQPERETGIWIIDSGYPQHCWCSNCNHRFDLFDPKSIHFCPNCGREMKTCVWKTLDERRHE